MARGDTSLASHEYDDYLAKNGKERELRQRQVERRNANKGYEGYHFGIDAKGPVYTRDKAEFKKALEKRGLLMRDDVHRSLR
jgi:hypothetical protein